MPRPRGRRVAEQQRGAGRRVDLLVVMHLDDFDVEFIAEGGGDALDQRGEQIDAEAHIAGFDDPRPFGRRRDDFFRLGGEAGGADHVHEAVRGRVFDQHRGGGRDGEIQHAVGCSQDGRGIGAHLDAVAAHPREFAGILPDRGGTRRLQRAGQNGAAGFGNCLDQGPAHPPPSTSDDEAHIRHGLSPVRPPI